VGFAEGLLDRRAELLRQGQPATAARALAVTEAVHSFYADSGARGWTLDQERISSLAHDVLGLEEEYRDRHGYPREQARRAAFGEVLEGERARQEVPCRGGRPSGPSGQRACGARNAARTTTTADPAPDQTLASCRPAAARPEANRHVGRATRAHRP
jgi:hypothetical protein